MERREFLFASSLFTLGWLTFGKNKLFASSFHTQISYSENFNQNYDNHFSDQFPYSLPRLNYAYGAMEPFIDKQTMEIHHSKHHAAYVNNLNKALENQSFKNAPLIELFKKVSTLDKSIRNNGGGHYNHSLFWILLRPNPEGYKNLPEGKIAKAIETEFKSFDNFQKEFSEKATKIFGSGWCWLILNDKNKLKIVTTPNQDNPLMDVVEKPDRGVPLLGLDVWEHAYYLKYQNKRAEYIENWWNIIHWNVVEERYNQYKK